MFARTQTLQAVVALSIFLSHSLAVSGFVPKSSYAASAWNTGWQMAEDESSVQTVEEEFVGPEKIDSAAAALKCELQNLSERTNRGFQASAADREKAKEIIFDLARLNPTPEPASPYYSTEGPLSEPSSPAPTLAGKWTLIYTDAPDITGLDTSRNPFSTAKLGRIGQECNPPYIKNVIEWLRPDWAKDLPFSGSDDSQVLQKVVTSASAGSEKPLTVDLKIAGLELEAGSTETFSTIGNAEPSDLVSRIQQQGIPAGLLSINPVDLKGPLNPPFGQFEILYLDEDFRMIKTGQNFLAVNQRIQPGEEWF